MRRTFLPVWTAGALLVAAPAIAAPAAEEGIHVVREGETLNGIANRAGVTPQAIIKANGLKAPYVVRLGQSLDIPRKNPAPADVAAKRAAKTAARVIEERTPRAPGASPEAETLHVVLPGETLGGIAARAKVPRILIAEANGLQPPYAVREGQKLQIPRTRRHTVGAGESGFAVAMKYGVPWDQIATANTLDPDAPVKPGQTLLIPTVLAPPPVAAKPLSPQPAVVSVPVIKTAPKAANSARFAWPLSGAVRRGYSTGNDYHDGLDITAPKGAMVRAAAAGTVKFAGREKDQFGNLVVLDHGDGWYSAYGCLSRLTVKEGASVAAGERVGLVGDTCKNRLDELHFEVRREGGPVDPLDELPKAP